MVSRRTWMNGKLLAHAEAVAHIDSEAVLRGMTAIEALRVYRSASGQLVFFRVQDHLDRLFDTSMPSLGLHTRYDRGELLRAIRDVIEANEITNDAHIMVFAYAEQSQHFIVGNDPTGCGVCVTVKEGASEAPDPLRVMFSPWRRPSDILMSSLVKVAAKSLDSRIALADANSMGSDAPIMLTRGGGVAGGSAMNIFVVRNGVLTTPRASAEIVAGITRDTVLTLARTGGMDVDEREVGVTELYSADEMFFCSTIHQITPIVAIGGYPVGGGKAGPITERLQAEYDSTVRALTTAPDGWILPVDLVQAPAG